MTNSQDDHVVNLKSELVDGLDRCRDLMLHYKAMLGAPANDSAPLPQDDDDDDEAQDGVG